MRRFPPTGRVARYAHQHERVRRLLWRLRLLPNTIGPFYSREAP